MIFFEIGALDLAALMGVFNYLDRFFQRAFVEFGIPVCDEGGKRVTQEKADLLLGWGQAGVCLHRTAGAGPHRNSAGVFQDHVPG